MSEIKNIHQRLLEVMKEVDYVQKEAKKNGMQYTFVSHDAVTAKVRPSFIKHGILATPSIIDFSQDGNRTSAKVRVDFVNVDDPKDSIVVVYFGYGIDNQDKGPGKAISYAVKYAYLKVLGLETGDDPERDNIDYKESKKEEAPKKATMSNEHQALLDAIERSANIKDLQENYDKAKLLATQKNDKIFYKIINEATARIKSNIQNEVPNEPFSQ